MSCFILINKQETNVSITTINHDKSETTIIVMHINCYCYVKLRYCEIAMDTV